MYRDAAHQTLQRQKEETRTATHRQTKTNSIKTDEEFITFFITHLLGAAISFSTFNRFGCWEPFPIDECFEPVAVTGKCPDAEVTPATTAIGVDEEDIRLRLPLVLVLPVAALRSFSFSLSFVFFISF